MKKKRETTIYKDGAVIRLNNRRISFKETEEGVLINFRLVAEQAEKPAAAHMCHRGKVRETGLKLTKETMDNLMFAYLEYKRQKNFLNSEIEKTKGGEGK